MDNMRLVSTFGIFVLLFVGWLCSSNRKLVPFRVIFWGVGLQFVFGFLILGLPAFSIAPPARFIFEAANTGINSLLDYTGEGSRFVFGSLMDTQKSGFILAFQVLPTIIFVGALMSVLYHVGLMQKVINSIAWVMQKTMKTSGAETLSAAANIFVGQTEAPMVIKPFVKRMTESEIFCVMVGGMATIAGGVMAAYVGLLRERIPDIAGHLLSASVMSAPAALLMAKLMLPETKRSETHGGLPKEASQKVYSNLIDAATGGALDGLQLALNVGTMLIAFIALVAMANGILGWAGDLAGFAQWGTNLVPEPLRAGGPVRLSFQVILGWVFAPFAWVLGVPWSEAPLAGAILGEKTALNEFVAYIRLTELGQFLSDRSYIILTYALCGFANFASIAIQVGGIGSLAPERRSELARLGFSAMIAGTLASFMTAAIVGIFI